ncbi:tRNA (5-methylaminomethyl-2-thiouridine)(34)-methyltransferase MnmD [Zophobihabitans entericus]|uniref:tRNA (5-methylaminomethyl-2-thiouridine)(34)-methyltransferase MnmD n=1 Tax=Zophobihabitans entericus TaxID=1635327 RepID=A0A6G9IA55_9GAMM|nr:tRNA (5-methylaminomethyl-2-thiouridine)(34)-methyltransferase MnmD [Zophobihabitans entericus]QIQ21115.1 tRNA (5-methylaminomethyl-2-thiouridine)(34)-methyltransferase MnmD [Zophobihabitans entericus]
MNTPLTNAKIRWNEQGDPVSEIFEDVYFSDDSGIEETRYVFLDSNHLAERFLNSTETVFTIGETGFGSGLNFLAVWQYFLAFRQQNPDHPLKKLHFISVEKYPLLHEDMQKIHVHYPEIHSLAVQLQACWNRPKTGKQTIHLDSCQLDLWFCDIAEYPTYLKQEKVLIEAWFFDGFAPAKNQDMWSESVFKQLYALTRPKGTFATFTAAGFVRRNLQSAGFIVEKRKGFGRKREMLVGIKQ